MKGVEVEVEGACVCGTVGARLTGLGLGQGRVEDERGGHERGHDTVGRGHASRVERQHRAAGERQRERQTAAEAGERRAQAGQAG